jgi:ribosomal protein S6--L-glutamate ligase
MKGKTKLRIGILDFSGTFAGTPDAVNDRSGQVFLLRKAIREQGHVPVTYKVEKCQMFFHGRKSEILYNNKKIRSCDVLIPKVSASAAIDVEVSLVNQFQMMNVPVVNGFLSIARAKNKLRTLQILTKYNIPVPQSIVVRKLEYIDEAIKKVNGYPVILKTPFGSWGIGVVLLESRRSLYSALDIIWKSLGSLESNIILIQAYVAEAAGSDYRAFVLGDRVVAAMKRTASPGDFRSNISTGGSGESVTLTEEEQKLAVRASKVMGLRMCGVDILRSKKGPLIMELNANPGFLGLSRVTGIDIAAEIVKYSVAMVKEKRS